ncbi:MAG: Gfo/Idh/MocA family oxidoreductase [Verrucomicrobia bacterium]|nr:Gfo/Idh/MocA family oxidoreductase [Verrucomicrobiota bacterium]
MPHLTRRNFLKSTALSAAALSLPASSWAQVRGPNEDIRVAVIGFNGQGGSHIGSLSKAKGARITALCDCDSDVLAKGAKRVGENVETYTDIRKLLESKNVDAVSIATPNHWHALGTIWAIQAGKDVYVEKPVSHNVSEGRRMVEFARQHNKIVQTGTQSRSSRAGIAAAVEWVRAGNLGKIKVSRGICYKPRGSIGKSAVPLEIPTNVDFDLWCGPAAKLPILRKKLHYDWHWVWNTGCGDLGNQGIHEMDVARWFLGVKELSPRVFAVGGRLGYVDDGETPNTMVIYHDYPDAPLIFEVRGLPSKAGSKEMDTYMGARIGIVIECEGGHVTVPSYNEAKAYDKDGKLVKEFKGGEGHHDNWLKAVRSRKKEDLNADILEGHLSSALCHTGNISYRLGQQMEPGEIREQTKADAQALEACERAYEHLKLNEVDLKATQATLGLVLKMDPKTEKFIGNAKADEMLTRPYRPGFVVPAKV